MSNEPDPPREEDDADLEEEAGVILDEAQLNEDDPDFEPIEENGEEDAADQLEPPFEENENGEEDKAADVADVADAEFEAPLQENGEEDHLEVPEEKSQQDELVEISPEKAEEADPDRGPRREVAYQEACFVEPGKEMVRVTLVEKNDWKLVPLGCQARLSCVDEMVFRIQDISKVNPGGAIAVDLLPVEPGWREIPSFSSGTLQVLLAATDLEEATMSAIHFLAAQDSAEAERPDGWPSVDILSFIQDTFPEIFSEMVEDDMRPLLEGSILFKVIDDSLQRVVCRTSSSPLEDSVRRLLARNKSAEEIGPRDPFLDRQLLQFAPSVCFNMTEEDPGGLVTLRKPLPALEMSLKPERDLLPEPDGRHGASDATASTACAKSSQEESRRRSRRRHSGDAKQSNPTLAKPNASNASSRRAEPLRLRPRERPKAGTANAASRARNARTSRETAAKTSSAPRLRIRSRSREELRRRHSRHSTEDVLRRGEPPRTSTRISLMARDTRSRAHASHASSRASARDSTGRGPARDAPDEPSTRAEGRHSARHSTRRTRETEDRLKSSTRGDERRQRREESARVSRADTPRHAATREEAPRHTTSREVVPRQTSTRERSDRRSRREDRLDRVHRSSLVGQRSADRAATDANMPREGRRDEGRSGHRERRREDPGREVPRSGRPSNPSKSDRSRHEERRRSRSRRRESSKELNGRINGHDTSARGPPAPLPADVMGGVWQDPVAPARSAPPAPPLPAPAARGGGEGDRSGALDDPGANSKGTVSTAHAKAGSAQALGTALDTAACAGCGAGSGAAAEHEELLGRCPRAVLAADLTEPSKEKTAASRWCMYRNVAERARIDVMSHMLDEPFAQALLVQKGSCYFHLSAPMEIPDPSSLAEANIWVQRYGPVSTPTASAGDWKIWPHMQSKEAWHQAMGTRGGLMAKFLEARGIFMDGCQICHEFNRSTQSNFEGHVGGRAHFKHWCHLCCREDAKDMSSFREKWWEEWIVKGSAIRFNHADGVVELRKNYPSIQPSPSQAASGSIPAPPSPVEFTPDSSNVVALALQNPGNVFSLCLEENVYYLLYSHDRLPTGKPVTELAAQFWQEWILPLGILRFNHLHGQVWICRGKAPRQAKPMPFPSSSTSNEAQQGPLSSKALRSPPMPSSTSPQTPSRPVPTRAAAHGVEDPQDLAVEGVWFVSYPPCYQEHLGAAKHWDALYPYAREGVCIEAVRDRLWNTMMVSGGWVRINELDGAIEIAKGSKEPGTRSTVNAEGPPAIQQGRAGNAQVGPVLGSDEVGRWRSKCLRLYQSKAQAVQDELRKYDLHPGQIRCDACGKQLAIMEFASHLRSQDHFNQIHVGDAGAEDPQQVFQAGSLRLKLNLADLDITVEKVKQSPDGWEIV
ncbi:unnamed protein product [Durusdinium trenchii]|uniref:C2H2-type domain-containing protein n=1 Tax=Durusdinium trenchii TaxID=1381693 RepID=A0ABP0Q8Y1_9DINO